MLKVVGVVMRLKNGDRGRERRRQPVLAPLFTMERITAYVYVNVNRDASRPGVAQPLP